MKKILAIALALVMVLGLFAGCKQTPPTTTAKPNTPDGTTTAGKVEVEYQPIDEADAIEAHTILQEQTLLDYVKTIL